MSKVVTSGDGRVKFPINEPAAVKAPVADRRVPRLLRRPRGAAHRGLDDGHRRDGRRVVGAGRQVPPHAGLLLRAAAPTASARSTSRSTTCAASASSSTATTRATSAGLHEAARRPADDLLRDHRAPRRARLRGGQTSRRCSKPSSASRRSAGTSERYVSMGDVPPKRHTQFRDDDGRPARRGGHGLRGLLGQRVDPLSPCIHRCDVASVGLFTPIVREEWVPDAHVHRLTDTAPLSAAGDPVFGRRVPQRTTTTSRSRSASPRSTSTPSTATARATRCCFVHDGSGVVETNLRRAALSRRRLRRHPARHDLPDPLRRRPPDVADVPTPRRDRDAQPLPQPLRPAARARAVLPARLPPAARAARVARRRRRVTS